MLLVISAALFIQTAVLENKKQLSTATILVLVLFLIEIIISSTLYILLNKFQSNHWQNFLAFLNLG
jgi:hypothetical protein